MRRMKQVNRFFRTVSGFLPDPPYKAPTRFQISLTCENPDPKGPRQPPPPRTSEKYP